MSKSDGVWNSEKTQTYEGAESITNAMRADRADQCVLMSKKLLGEHGPVCEASAVDLLTDIGHLCDREGWNFKACLETAFNHWETER